MSGLLLGTSFAVSSGLIVYGIERDYITRSQAPTFLITWAVIGLFLALLAVLLRKRED